MTRMTRLLDQAIAKAVFEDGDPELIGHALAATARAKRITE